MLSPSQIQTWADCKRKWSFIYVDHIELPPGPAQAFGTTVHKQLEEFYEGTPLPFSSLDETERKAAYVAQSGLEHLPPPSDHLEREKYFTFESNGLKYRGFIDLRDQQTLTIYDHKTTSSLRWAKTPETLSTDLQAVIYAHASMQEWMAPEVNLQWTYMQTRGANRSLPVRITMQAEETGALFALIETVAKDIEAAREAKAPTLSLPPSPEMCEKYGGCPFRHLCNLSPQERMTSIMSNDTENLLARLRKQAATSINPPEGKPADVVEQAPPTDRAPPKASIGTLYVNCIPLKGVDFFSLTELFELANKEITTKTFKDQDGNSVSVPDYRFLPYGHGPATFKQLVLGLVDNRGPAALIADTRMPETQIVMSGLLERAERIVRGV